MIRIGAHQSISGGYAQALERIKNIGGNCLQIFSSSPRGWNFAKTTKQQAINFVVLKNKYKIDPVFFHASYLINLADNQKIGHLSKQSLINELIITQELGISGSIVHLGSYKNQKTKEKYHILIANIKDVLAKTPHQSSLIIENSGNKKIGQSIDEIAQIIKDVDNDRIGVCLDTCHLFSAGYDLSTDNKLKIFINEFDKKIGLKKLMVFHFNDSKDPFNSGHDRHENIGKGAIPIAEFRLIMTHPQLRHLPFIIETPGFNNKGPDKKNLDILKNLLD